MASQTVHINEMPPAKRLDAGQGEPISLSESAHGQFSNLSAGVRAEFDMAIRGSERVPQADGSPPRKEILVPRFSGRAEETKSAHAAVDQRILELVKRFRAGEDAAFDELAPLAARMAFHTALRSVADANVAEEIAQEALVRVYRHAGEMADAAAFKTWFHRIVLNLVHDYFRRSVRQDHASTTLEEIRMVEAKSKDEPLTNLEREGLRSALTEALNCLDEKHREAFLMKEVEGMSHAEIAKTLDVPEGTVWSRLSYARRKLQEKLRRMGYAG